MQIVEKMGQWTTKKKTRKTLSSHQKDNVKHDGGTATSGFTGDTVGGGRSIFSNAGGNVPFATEAHSKDGKCEVEA